ncbi:LysE family transporter [Ideonella sp. 4Y11]|uniref:LysE family transporter n=1 Tax=Ideonella aquatica TaxID=2824119 RepID=A0A940YL68_9BURK|nr:LysE family transporter [Ideonella aquatica]MBQ0959032.1 LysE family transporter [Ideonella aquatica]
MEFSTWLPFFLATVAISLSPGPGAIAAMGAGLNHGFRRGQSIAFGLALGVWTQLLVVGVGLGALLATSALAFAVLKWVGVAYLVWLGVQQWRSPAAPVSAPGGDAVPSATRAQLVLRGWGVNALNPKGTVFLLAVMPQFLDTARPMLAQYLTIAATFGVVEFTVMTGYAALASRVLRLLRTPAQIRWMNRSFGGLFVAAGAFLALFKRGV